MRSKRRGSRSIGSNGSIAGRMERALVRSKFTEEAIEADRANQKLIQASKAIPEDDDEDYKYCRSDTSEEHMVFEDDGEDDDHDDYDTLGLHWKDDKPKRGGVLPNAAISVGDVSAVTTPTYFIPLNKVQQDTISEAPKFLQAGLYLQASTTIKYLQAGLEASNEGEYDAAAAYFSSGRKHLGSNGWKVDYTTMLALCSEGANASYIIGDYDTMNQLIDEVLSMDISVKDKFKVYEVKILALQGVGKHHESIALGIHVRQQLGLSTPKDEPASKLKIFLGYIKTNHILGKRTAEQLANLPELTDERIIMGQRILELLEISCYQAQPMMFPLIIFLMIEATIKYGINASSCDAFTGFGVLLCGGFNDFQRGHEMARVAELILAKPGMNRMASRSIFVMEGLIKHWTTRLNGTLEPLLKGYQIGLDCGEGQSAGLCQSLHVTHTFYSGGSLKGFAEMIAPIVGLQNDTKTNDSGAVVQTQSDLDIHVVYLYGWKKLCGILPDDNEQSLDDIVKVASRTGNQSLRGYIFAVNLELLVFFGEWNTATNILIEAGDIRDALVATYTGVRFTCLGALIYLKAAQSSAGADRMMWKKNALKEIKLIRGWYKKGNVNIIHNLQLLEAELDVLNGKSSKAEGNFIASIATAEKNNFIQDQALSHELASAYYERQGDNSKRDHHIENAIRCYSEWGATAKVLQLKTAKSPPIPLKVYSSELEEIAAKKAKKKAAKKKRRASA